MKYFGPEVERRKKRVEEYLKEHGKTELSLDDYMILSDEFDKEWWSKKRYVIKGLKGTIYEGHCYGPVGFNDPIEHSELVFLYDEKESAEYEINTDLKKIKDQIEIIEIGEDELRNIYVKSNII